MTTNVALRLISSMAMRAALAELLQRYRRERSIEVSYEAVGGVEAVQRLQSGEPADAVVLSAGAIEQLLAVGRLMAGSRIDLARSGVAIAVKAGAPRPAIASEEELRSAVLAARSLSYSTGPSGVYLEKLFARWGIGAQVSDRIMVAPPGVPVGSLVAAGAAELGFQQLSELVHLPGIDVIGPLPPTVQVVTTFSGGVSVSSARADASSALLHYLASANASDLAPFGLEPV